MDVSVTGNPSPAARLPERPQDAAEDKERISKDSEIERREADRSAEARDDRRDADRAAARAERREKDERGHRVDIRV